ncbi:MULTISPECIES: IclR family transcriptional regulator C-terminal domain-containing protein [Rhodomicrobium]|uniref:IclR family transcriptional regulator domain-containing protein n=1 Tax=Rhodomicrobium TaxID=1068 RepID=UPI000B4AF185|nr:MULTISPECIES: IclR family transcriptional regulator C-terminal domain-containing protein [Rhodomicrobium]
MKALTQETPGVEAGAGRGESRDFVASLEKGLAVIEAFGPEHQRLTLADVARRTGLTRAAARRYLLTLTQLRYADFDGRFFSLSPRILRLGYAYLSSTPLPSRIQPFLEGISEETGESSSAAVIDGDDIVYIARSATKRIMSIGLGVGSRLPIYCTSLGRALLAYLPEAEQAAYLARADLTARTPKTVTGIAALQHVLRQVREDGFAMVDEELEPGLRSIAVPVLGPDGGARFALNIGAHAAWVSAEDMTVRFLPVLRKAGEALRGIV